MKILLVSDPPLRSSYGGARPFVELGAELERLGWDVDLRSLSGELPGEPARMREARALLLREIAMSQDGYDILDFDHGYLPYPRSDFPAETLLVARSVLLCHQVASRRFPQPMSARRAIGWATRERARRRSRQEMLRFAETTVAQADLVNVSNDDDASVLVSHGIPKRKILVFPFGLSDVTAAQFEALATARPHGKVVAFVGTFDWRKGAADMPAIVDGLASQVPGVTFRLLGTRGMFDTAYAVARRFPRNLRARIEIVPEFEPSTLPGLLGDCAVGFFPSYLEGFGFGVLEMLAAALPVVAYDIPGPASMLPETWLVPPGDGPAMTRRLAELIDDADRLSAARLEARHRSRDFRWSAIADETAAVYTRAMEALRAPSDTRELA